MDAIDQKSRTFGSDSRRSGGAPDEVRAQLGNGSRADSVNGDGQNSIDLEQFLQDKFGLEEFRSAQRPVIESVISHRDVLCVMPTGGGKSLCYQLPALLLPGVTLVISPLIALMKDQVDGLVERGIRATVINSSLDPSEVFIRIRDIEQGRYDLVYVAPERFRSPRFIEAMRNAKLALFAVDEAHCISEWGHDFRPDYARLGHARKVLGFPPTIALTATATKLVRDDIIKQLEMKDPAIYVSGFDRPNLSYQVVTAGKQAEKLQQIKQALKRNPGPSIIYVSSRKNCETVSTMVANEIGKTVVMYHAGLDRDQRSLAQDSFMGGEVDIVVATNAFGMGVDKPDIRSVIHYNIPGTLEAYYQEAGRAGRDNKPSECLLLSSYGDRKIQELFIESEFPSRGLILNVYEFLRKLELDPIELTQLEIHEQVQSTENERAVGAALKILERSGAIEQFRARENMAIIRFNVDPEESNLVSQLSAQATIQRQTLLGLQGMVGQRIGEPIYFQMETFVAQIGLDLEAFKRAIRQLTKHFPGVVDYVPPFRGNAIRVIDRQRKASELNIDFKTLNNRRAFEFDKLNRMCEYTSTPSCRRKYVLDYFGETASGNCGNCDRCADRGIFRIKPQPIDTAQGREILLKALSGVARAKGRVGKVAIAQMLIGSNSARMQQLGLSSLTTFGVLSSLLRQEVESLLEALATADLIETRTVDRGRPVIQLTTNGWKYLKSENTEPVELSLSSELLGKIRGIAAKTPSNPSAPPAKESASKPAPAKPNPTTTATSFVPEVVESHSETTIRRNFKFWRLNQAGADGIRPFGICSDAVLESLISSRPTNLNDLAATKGIGPKTLERYGEAFLELLRGGIPDIIPGPGSKSQPQPQPQPETPAKPKPTPPPTSKPVAAPVSPPPPKPTSPPTPPPVPSKIEPPKPKLEAPAPKIEPTPPQPASKPADAPKPQTQLSPSSAIPRTHRTEEWTGQLLDKGFSFDQIAEIRGLEPSVVIRHATWIARSGKTVPLAAFLDSKTIAQWDDWRKRHDETTPPPDSSLGHWNLYLLCRK